MDKLDKKVIAGLSPPARKQFDSLDRNSQKRILKKARKLADCQRNKQRQKGRTAEKSVKRRGAKKREEKENKKRRGGISDRRQNATRFASGGQENAKEMTVMALHMLLLGERETGSDSGDSADGEDFGCCRQTPVVPKRLARTSAGRVSGSVRFNRQRQRRKKQAQKKAGQAAKTGAQGATGLVRKAAGSMTKALEAAGKAVASNPTVWIFLFSVLLVSILIGAIAMMIGAGGAAINGDSTTYQAQVSEQTESYRSLVEQYCEKYDIDEYVDLCLAMIEQESGGSPPDVMQTEQSYYNTSPPIDSAEESIDCGTHQLSDCLKQAKCRDSSDIAGISLAIQGYNFGNGYINWAVKNYQGYTKENAVIFSKKMCAELGYSSYGDVEYVAHVLRYYVANPDTAVTNESAQSILKELKENNTASSKVWAVIEKGASLIGPVQYSMEKRQADGRDNPAYLDCSSFAAWSFHKAGYTGVAYGSTTATFISSAKFTDIAAKDLRPGDIGLKSKTAGTGGANHVGIYCGTLKNGTKVWLHCTSESGSSLTGNTSGVMFGAYANFTYFRRLKVWNK